MQLQLTWLILGSAGIKKGSFSKKNNSILAVLPSAVPVNHKIKKLNCGLMHCYTVEPVMREFVSSVNTFMLTVWLCH